MGLFQCVKKLKAAGYEGTLSLEFEGLEDPERGVRIGYDNLRRYLNVLGA